MNLLFWGTSKLDIFHSSPSKIEWGRGRMTTAVLLK